MNPPGRSVSIAESNEQTRARVGAALDREALAQAQAEGRALMLDDAVQLALEAASTRSSIDLARSEQSTR